MRRMKERKELDPEGRGDKSLRELGLTLMHPFFGEEQRMLKMFDIWDDWSDDVKDEVQLILIDDHGTPSVEEMFSDRIVDYNLSVYRIQDDLKFNVPGALNLGMMMAATPWILTMDSDCAFKPDVMQRLLDFKPDRGEFYSFYRERITEGSFKGEEFLDNIKVLPCTILLHKDQFIAVNGFDEDFTGTWSTQYMDQLKYRSDLERIEGFGYFDNAFVHRINGEGYRYIQQHGYLVTEWMPDLVGKNTVYGGRERTFNRRVWRYKQLGHIPFSTDMLRFKWERVMHNVRGSK